MHPGRKGVDSETAFVIAIIVVFIVIGVFVFIYACCVTEEKLKAATKKEGIPEEKGRRSSASRHRADSTNSIYACSTGGASCRQQGEALCIRVSVAGQKRRW
ncbi:hypothetical protein MRX96_031165 [Rhipicephalus microplus]